MPLPGSLRCPHARSLPPRGKRSVPEPGPDKSRQIVTPAVAQAHDPCYNIFVADQKETRIVACKRCGIHTRHVRQEWVQRPLPLLLLTRRVKVYTAWACTKCGHRRSIRARYLLEKDV